MSWTQGASRNYPNTLKIEGSAFALVRFINEPKTHSFGNKTDAKTGEQVPDERPYAKVMYLGGTAKCKNRDKEITPAIVDVEYTLWIGRTLLTAFLDALNHEDVSVAPTMEDTIWKISRGGKVFGGNTGYIAELIEDESAIPKVDPEEMLMLTLKDTLEKIGELPKKDWYAYCEEKGAKNGEEMTGKMLEKGYLATDALMVTKAGN